MRPMQLADNNIDRDQEMPPTIYAALVDSLFQNPAPMLAGAICGGAGALMTAVKTGNLLQWHCAVLIGVIGFIRAVQINQYGKRTTVLNAAEVAQWEWRYMSAGSIYAAALGVWCVLVLGSDDPVAHMLCTAVTVAYIAAGSGRTYGRPWISHLQVLLACGPMSLALIVHGGAYYVGFALLNVLFFLGLKRITSSLHDVYVRALVATERVASIAGQFDTALNNMPHGLCMFDVSGRLAVINNRFNAM